MSKILRKTSKLFASTAGGSDIGVFGSLAAGSPAYSTDPAVIQSLSNFLTGWAAETIATRRPAYQDFNALDFLTFYQLGYIFQAGVAEWDAGTTYYTGSIVNDGTGVLYNSLVDSNLNNAVSDGTKWAAVNTSLSIHSLTEKTVPVSADLLLIEDSAAGNAQKKVQIGNLPQPAGFGEWQTKSPNTVYQAATDGFVMAYCPNSPADAMVTTDSSNPPNTVRFQVYVNPGYSSAMSPVKKGDYWTTNMANGSPYWLPLGS